MFRSIIQNSPFGVWVVDKRGSVVFRNKSAEELLPLGVEDGIGSNISELLPALSIQEGKLCIESLGDSELENIIAIPKGRGELRFCEVTLSQYTDVAGQTFNIVNMNEVTSRVRAWQALRDQEERWNLAWREARSAYSSLIFVRARESLQMHGSNSLVYVNLTGGILTMNGAHESIRMTERP